jgi:hypothetical protein
LSDRVVRSGSYRFREGGQRAGVVEECLSCLSQVRPGFGKIGPKRYRFLQVNRRLLSIVLFDAYPGTQIIWIGGVRHRTENFQGAIERFGSGPEFARLDQIPARIYLRLRKRRLGRYSLLECAARHFRVGGTVERLAQRIPGLRRLRAQPNSFSQLGFPAHVLTIRSRGAAG